MVQRRPLSLAQRSAKNERDRQRRREHNLEFERLQRVEAEFEEMAPLLEGFQLRLTSLGNIAKQLVEESKRLSDVEPCLIRKIHELENIFRQNETEGAGRSQFLTQWQLKEGSSRVIEQIQEMLLSLTCEQEPHQMAIVHSPVSSHAEMLYTNEFIQEFIEKLDEKEKSKVDFPDFKGLTEELEKSGRFTLPPSLVPVDEILQKKYGDITAESNQSTPLIRDSYILFCSVIKEMNELQLEHVDLDKLILWRDAINSGLSIGFKGNFAIEHLKKIGRAYFGSRAQSDRELNSMEERIAQLRSQLYVLEKKHDKIIEEKNSAILRECLRDQAYFQGKPLSAGLFL